MKILKYVQLLLATTLGAVLWLFFSVAIHELGHAFAAATMTKDDYRVESIQIWPSLQLYPEVKFSPATTSALGETFVQLVAKAEPMAQMNTFRSELELPLAVAPNGDESRLAGYPRALAPLDTGKLDETRAQADYHIISLMGAVMTGFVSLVAIVCIITLDLSGFKLYLASVLGLLHLDALLYSLLPLVFGLRHLGAVGGLQPEPITALAYFGISPMWTATVFVLLSFMQLALLIQHWQKQEKISP